jgi:hypothetical protein
MNTTTGSGTVKNDGFGMFLTGVFIGFLVCVVFTLIFLANEPSVIQSNKRIQPEKRLTTDGKTVDTLFIYKQER